MKITVFTPTFNRGYIIEKLYRSLQAQTFTDFEWLVIDDGSEDNTMELFKRWMADTNPFTIRYFKVENGGKHRAINKATDLAKGELFFIVDSDDTLTEDALESVVSWELGLENKAAYCAVAGNKGISEKDLWGTTFDGSYMDATSLEREKYNITGDKAEVFFTKVIKEYKFCEFEGESFITECTVWDKMAADGYKIRWFNKIIYLCDYLPDGLTNSGDTVFANNPQGTAYLYKQQIEYYKLNLKDRLSSYNAYYQLVKCNVGLKLAARYLEIHMITLVWALFLVACKNILIGRRFLQH
ncbi:glycosyltransferase family 2 protein [Paenibacillus sp. NPDC056579]|uniref:glycosyltransferase family 2 protein n=1 Tax=Paenibacillus sp. NPDC056579 TaxID=3345871 RepID=UPI0036CDA546